MDASQNDEQLIRSGRMVAIGWLTPALIHDLNNSLLVLLGIADLELDSLPPGSKERERMETVRDAGIEIRDSVARLAGFTRATLDDERKLSLVEVARSVVALVQRLRLQRDVTLEDSYCEEDLPVLGNEAQLAQALLHLLMNAFQAAEPGGQVRLELRREDERGVALVADSGPGVEPSQSERIFDLFETTKLESRGGGLGLAAARAIARRHGGELCLRPSSQGAEFALELPLSV